MSAIREFARDKRCEVRLVGICCGDPARSIWSHARWLHAGKGKGLKAPDVCGAIACTPCDAAYDQGTGVRQAGLTREQVDRDWLDGHLRSLVLLHKAGLVP